MKRGLSIIFLVLVLPFVIAVTGEVITGEVSESPTNVSVFVLPDAPIIRINSPEKTTYYDRNVFFNYSVTNDIDTVWYSLDGGDNVSLGSVNSGDFFLNLDEGGHIIYFYANNSLGESGVSVVFSISSDDSPKPPSDPPSGLGGPSDAVSDFSMDKDVIQIFVKQGSTERDTLKLLNMGNTILQFNLDARELSRFIALSEEVFSLSPGRSKIINIDFFAKEEEIGDSYIGVLKVNANGISKEINLIIEIGEKKPLFDMSVDIQDKIVSPGETLEADFGMINLGDLRNFDILLYYSVQDFEGEVILFKEESIAIDERLDITREIKLPWNLKDGTYVLYSKISYAGLTASGTDIFRVKEDRISFGYILLIIFGGLGVVYFVARYFHKKDNFLKNKFFKKIWD